jgi:hypothetical protein
VSSESREISPFEFLDEDEDGDFRPIDREVTDPKDESAPASASSSELIQTPELEPSVTASTGTTKPKEDESSTANSHPQTNPGKSEQLVEGALLTLPPIPTPGSQNEDKQTSQTKQS